MTDDQGLTGEQRDRLATLRRRRDHLADRVRLYRADGDPSRARAELSATSWAIRVIENAAMAGVLGELE